MHVMHMAPDCRLECQCWARALLQLVASTNILRRAAVCRRRILARRRRKKIKIPAKRRRTRRKRRCLQSAAWSMSDHCLSGLHGHSQHRGVASQIRSETVQLLDWRLDLDSLPPGQHMSHCWSSICSLVTRLVQ